MRTNTTITTGKEVSVKYETAKFALGVGMSMAAFVGLWGVGSLVSALAGNGPVGLIKAYFGAVFGM